MNDTVETQSVTTLSGLYNKILTNGSILMNRVQTIEKTLDVWFELFFKEWCCWKNRGIYDRVAKIAVFSGIIDCFDSLWMPKKLRQLVLWVEIVRINDFDLSVVIFKQVIGLPEGENFILVLDEVTMALINSVCGQFALFDRGCICIFAIILLKTSVGAHFIKERLHSGCDSHLLCRTYWSKYWIDR